MTNSNVVLTSAKKSSGVCQQQASFEEGCWSSCLRIDISAYGSAQDRKGRQDQSSSPVHQRLGSAVRGLQSREVQSRAQHLPPPTRVQGLGEHITLNLSSYTSLDSFDNEEEEGDKAVSQLELNKRQGTQPYWSLFRARTTSILTILLMPPCSLRGKSG